jgi:MerR family transcriptional regulator, light-induced transcriptional regulator
MSNCSGLSIGTLSKSTGIPVNTIRTWELRYGFPLSKRSKGNQRIYSYEVVEHLKMISFALKNGFRAGQIVGMDLDEIQEIVSQIQSSLDENLSVCDEIVDWLDAAKNLDDHRLMAGFKSALMRLGLYQFIIQCVGPFLSRLGEEWISGEIKIFQEHFATNKLQKFLSDSWYQVSQDSKGPVLVCASLPKEKHFLGLYMAAAIASLQKYKIIFLQGNSPVLDIIECCKQSEAIGVLISVSCTSDPHFVNQSLNELRAKLPEDRLIILGGEGAPNHLRNILNFNDLSSFYAWLAENP